MPTTERLVLRPWRPSDRAPFAALNADPEVVRFLNGGVPFTRAESDQLLDIIDAHWAQHGFGLWCAAAREEPDSCLGFVGLAVPSFLPAVLPAVEVGWRLARPAWGRGLATEGARAALAPCLRRPPPEGRDLDHRPGQRALDPRRREARDAAWGRAPTPPNGPAIGRLRHFLARCGFFTRAVLTTDIGVAYVRSRRGSEPQRARPWGCEARRSEATALPRELTRWRAPRAARDRVAFVKAHLVE